MGLALKEEKGGGSANGGGNSKKGEDSRRRSPFLPPPPPATDFYVVVSGASCTPCAMFSSVLSPDAGVRLPGAPGGISGAWSGAVDGAAAAAAEEGGGGGGGAERRGPTTTTTVTLIHRFENDGMDFGAHNVTLEWLAFLERRGSKGGDEEGRAELEGGSGDDGATASSRRHRRFIFLNSSARGPFLPTYLPEGWHWTDAFSRDLDEEAERESGDEGGEREKGKSKWESGKREKKKVALVGAALTCLPAVDAGGPGPRVESWAFALSRKGLSLAKEAGVFGSHGCKLCADGVVVAGKKQLKETERSIEEKKENSEKNDRKKN